MNIYEATEQAYKNGYAQGYQDGKKNGVSHSRWEYIGRNIHGQRLTRCCHCKANAIEGGLFCRNCGCQMDLPRITQQTHDALQKMGRKAHGEEDQ